MSVISVFKQVANDILDIICPKVCLGCGTHLKTDNDDFMCSDCWTDLESKNSLETDDNSVTSKLGQVVDLEYGGTFLQFSKGDTVQHLLHNLKYFNHPEIGTKLGRVAAYKIKKTNRFADVDYILPVPMHPAKQKKRGYNQAEKISEGLSEILGIPIRNDVLRKIRNTKSQTKMNAVERYNNSSSAFSAESIEEISQKHFLIVDDVFTTGSTLSVCAEKLKEAMPGCKVSIFALAQA